MFTFNTHCEYQKTFCFLMGGINMVALVLNGLKPESYVLINSFSLFLDLK